MRASERRIFTIVFDLVQPDGSGGLNHHTLRLASDRIEPALTDYYYETRIKDFPSYKVSMQEIRWNKSLISFGKLRIINADGALDSLIENWTWMGRPVTIAMGTAEQLVSAYTTMVTGRVGGLSISDEYIDVTIEDGQADLWDSKLAAGTYSDTIPNLVSTCLTAAGITSIDSAMWATWAAAHSSWNGFIESASNGSSVGSLLDTIIPPLCCAYGFKPGGEFWIKTIAPPATGTPVLSFADDIELLSYGEEWREQAWKVIVEYYTNTTSRTYGSTSQQDSGIRTENPAAGSNTYRTCLTSSANAATVRGRWWALDSVARTIAKAKAMVDPSSLAIPSDLVKLARPRYGIDRYQLAFTLNYLFSTGQVEMELLT